MFSLRSVLLLCLASSTVAFMVAPRPMMKTAICVAVDPSDVSEEEPVNTMTEFEVVPSVESTSTPSIPSMAAMEEKLNAILPEDMDTEKIMKQAKTTFDDVKTKVVDYVESDEFKELSSKAMDFAKDVSGKVFKAAGDKLKELNEAKEEEPSSKFD